MLVKCPECDLQVSDQAKTCPHCGYPIKAGVRTAVEKPKPKHRRLPNGFGSITEIKGKYLRKPFLVRVCVGKRDDGKPILKAIGYYETYNDGYTALLEYNRNPYDLSSANMKLSELYERWTAQHFPNISAGQKRSIRSAWNYCHMIHDMPVQNIRARHIKGVIEDGTFETIEKNKPVVRHTTPNTKERIKSMFNCMLDYAVEYEIVERNYARTFKLSKDVFLDQEKEKKPHICFTDEEMEILWKNINKPYVDVVIIQCYSGWRPQELGLIKMSNVNIKEWSFIGGMKTDAGEERKVPIHPRIRDLVMKHYWDAKNINSEYLFNCTDGISHKSNWKLTYDKYRNRFKNVVEMLGLNPEHRAHDPRKTFVTHLKDAGADQYAIKRMVGHSFKDDVTEAVYTERKFEWLEQEIQKMS